MCFESVAVLRHEPWVDETRVRVDFAIIFGGCGPLVSAVISMRKHRHVSLALARFDSA